MARSRRAFRPAAAALLALVAALPAAAQEDVASPEGDLTYAAMERYRMVLDWHPVGGVVPKGRLRFTNFIPMHPSGFRADQYNLYLGPTYGLGDGWEVSAGVTGAERLGPGGEAIFGGLGVQKQIVRESRRAPAVSIGGYGMTGHGHQSGTVYAAASKRVWEHGERGAWLHAGLKWEAFDSDDYGDGSGLRPYVGTTLVLTSRVLLSGEVSPAQPWERSTLYSARVTYLVRKRLGVSGGIRNNGYRTLPFVSLTL